MFPGSNLERAASLIMKQKRSENIDEVKAVYTVSVCLIIMPEESETA